jgi:hypothetical protein
LLGNETGCSFLAQQTRRKGKYLQTRGWLVVGHVIDLHVATTPIAFFHRTAKHTHNILDMDTAHPPVAIEARGV